MVADADHVPLQGGSGGWCGTILVDGLLRATGAVRREGAATVLTVRPSEHLGSAEESDVAEEGGRLLHFLAPGREHDIRIGRPDAAMQ